MSDWLYDYPNYYEIAFSFRDIGEEVDVFEESIRRYSLVPVRRLLELACGTAPHSQELVSRGYDYVGIDRSVKMLVYAAERTASDRSLIKLFCGDMINFAMNEQVDFVYTLLGSLYLKSQNDLASHFTSVSRVLHPGGLYFLDWCIHHEPIKAHTESWEMCRNGIRVCARYAARPCATSESMFEETIRLQVDDHGRSCELIEQSTRWAARAGDFLSFIERNPSFEFMGWWNRWDFGQPLSGGESVDRPITVLRRTS
jgi:SAM-dependent methyltransferase